MRRLKVRKKRAKAKKGVVPSASFRGTLRSERLREHLIERIGVLQSGEKLPGERVLAKECGLSLLTVNKVLSVLAAEGLVERRKGVGTFVLRRQSNAATPVANALRVLRFVVRSPERVMQSGARNYYALFYKGVREAAAADGIETIPTPYEITPDNAEALPAQAFDSPQVAGLFFVEQDVPDYRRLWSFLSENKRIVAFDFAAPESGLNSVLFDNAGGIRQAVEHCAAQGHQRIVYIGPEGNVGMPGDERLNGYREAMRASGLETFTQAILVPSGESSPAIREALRQPSRPTAFVGFMDHYLVPAAYAARESGLRIPNDISFVGFGDGLSREPFPPFQFDSIAFDEEAMGRTGYALWKSGARGLVKRLPGRLVKRGSVSVSPLFIRSVLPTRA